MLQNNNVRRKYGFPHLLCFSQKNIYINRQTFIKLPPNWGFWHAPTVGLGLKCLLEAPSQAARRILKNVCSESAKVTSLLMNLMGS